MTDMRIYRERNRAAITVKETIQKLLARGEAINISSLIQEITIQYAVPEKWVRQRITLYVESDKRVIEEEGELWLRLDSAEG